MVRELSARHALPRDIVEGVSERTGGVPLFVEEVTRLLLERGEQGGAQAIPPTLQQSLAARLDRLGAARETAQIGAVLGPRILVCAAPIRGRPRRGRAAIGAGAARRGRHSVRRGRWSASDLPLQARADPGRRLRQPAQEPPPGAPSPAAEILRESASPEPEASPIISRKPASTISRSNGGAKRAIKPFAARPSRRRSPISARRSPWRTGRRREGGGSAVGRASAQLHVAYGNALIAVAAAMRRPKRPKPSQELARSRVARRRTRLSGWRPTTACGPAATCAASCPRCGRIAEAFLSDVEARPDSPEAGVGSPCARIDALVRRRVSSKRAGHLERALALFQPGRDDDLAFRFGHDPGVAAMLYLALALWPLGDVERAISLDRDACRRGICGPRPYRHACAWKCMRPCSN